MREISVPSTRTFTEADLIPVVARGRATTNPRATPFEYHTGEKWQGLSSAELRERVDAIAAGLIASGRNGRVRVAFHVFNDERDVDLAARALAR